jgi:UDP-glucuronate decarboxylase
MFGGTCLLSQPTFPTQNTLCRKPSFSACYYPMRFLQVRIVRIFNTYGPKMALDDGRVVSNFVAQALTNQPITVYGDGSQTRSFQYVSDLIAGLVAVMDGDEIGPFNVGNPGEFNMLELANVSARVCSC